MKKTLLLTTTLCLATCLPAHADLLSSFEERLNNAMDSLRQEMQEFSQRFSSADKKLGTPSFSLDEHDNNITITIGGITADDIHAEMAENLLVVTAGETTVKVRAQDRLISMSVSRKTAKQADKNGTVHAASSSCSTISRTVSNIVALDKATVSFDDDINTLTITLPTIRQKQKTKTIPVNHTHKK